MRRARIVLLAALLGMALALVPTSAPALSLPATLSANRTLGALHGASPAVRSAFPIEYLGVSWLSGRAPFVRFDTAGRWGAWRIAGRDVRLPTDGHRIFSDLVPANDAIAYQVRGRDAGVKVVAINTTDGPRHLVWRSARPQPASAAVSEPPIVSRAQWGADESYRFDSTGHEVWPPAFYQTQKLIVHHTAGQNNDPNPAATIRAIYYYHAVTRAYGDIGYNFLIDSQGNVYKGRWSGPINDRNQADDSATGENAQGYGVTAAHTLGWNSGTVGIAILGTYSTVDITQASRNSLVNMLAWESEQNHIDPMGSSTFTNPVSGAQKFNQNISGHRDWTATDCPGDVLYGDLPSIRQQVAAELAGSPTPTPTPTSTTYTPASVTIQKGSSLGDPVSNLSADDGSFYRVAAAYSSTSGKYTATWYGQASGASAAGATQLTVTYDGSSTATSTQTLAVYNFATGSWTQFASAPGSSTDRSFTWSTANPAAYVSSSGTARLRVSQTASASFRSSGDLMSFTIQS